MTDPDAELDELVAMLGRAGLVESYINEDGKPAPRLTERGAQLGRALAMSGDEASADAPLAALLDPRL
jgi:hypothetical protein